MGTGTDTCPCRVRSISPTELRRQREHVLLERAMLLAEGKFGHIMSRR